MVRAGQSQLYRAPMGLISAQVAANRSYSAQIKARNADSWPENEQRAPKRAPFVFIGPDEFKAGRACAPRLIRRSHPELRR